MRKPKINPEYNVLTLVNMLSTAMHGDLNTNQWEQYFAFDAKMLSDIQELLQKINDWHVVDNAEGSTLDLLGNDFGVSRNGDDDEMYRFRIKSKRYIRISDGTCNSIYRVVSSCLGIPPTHFSIHGNDLPNQIVIDDIPANEIDNNDKIEWLLDQAENAVAYGIKIADIIFHLSEKAPLYVGEQVSISEQITTNVPPNITEKYSSKLPLYTGVQPIIVEHVGIKTDAKVIEYQKTDANLYFGVSVLKPYMFKHKKTEHFTMNVGGSIIDNSNINIKHYHGASINFGGHIDI